MRKSVVACVVFGFMSSSAMAWVPCDAPSYDQGVHEKIFSMFNKYRDLQIRLMDYALSLRLRTNAWLTDQSLITLSKQRAYSGKQIADATRITAQTVANARQAMTIKRRETRAAFDYGAAYGQGYNPCNQTAFRQALAARQVDMDAARAEAVTSEVLAGPGNYRSPVEARQELLDMNRKFCTQDQVDAGFCESVGGFPGAAVDVATLFESTGQDDAINEAKKGVINNMVGLPDDVVPKGAQDSASANAYVLDKARKDALASPAINSLKAIELEHSGTDGTETGEAESVAAMFGEEVKRYSGNSPKHQKWSSMLRGQNEHGLMIELLRAQGFKLAIMLREYQQKERMEAMLAALVANEMQSDGTESSTQVNAERTGTQRRQADIK